LTSHDFAIAILRDQLRQVKHNHEDILQRLRLLKEFISSDRFLSPRMEDHKAFTRLVSTFHASLMTPLDLTIVKWYSEKLGGMMRKYTDAFMLRAFQPEIATYYRNQFRQDCLVALDQVMSVTEREARHYQAYLMQCMYRLVGFCPVDRRELV
jgi:hypothetical protein